MEHWWNDTDRGKPQYSEKHLCQCHFIHPSSAYIGDSDRQFSLLTNSPLSSIRVLCTLHATTSVNCKRQD